MREIEFLLERNGKVLVNEDGKYVEADWLSWTFEEPDALTIHNSSNGKKTIKNLTNAEVNWLKGE